MNLIELQRVLQQLRLGGMATVLEIRLRQAQAETMAPIDLISCLVNDELSRRSDRLLERRRKQAAFWMGNARGARGFATLSRLVGSDPSPKFREHVVFALTEFQICDKATAIRNESGASSHDAYKQRQHERVRERLFREEDPVKDD